MSQSIFKTSLPIEATSKSSQLLRRQYPNHGRCTREHENNESKQEPYAETLSPVSQVQSFAPLRSADNVANW
jgi:hypothetical protein